ncbi:MAG: hypothetical protein RR725_08685 [Carnobacterium sp.]
MAEKSTFMRTLFRRFQSRVFHVTIDPYINTDLLHKRRGNYSLGVWFMGSEKGRFFKVELNRHITEDSQRYEIQSKINKNNLTNAVVDQFSDQNLTIYDTLRKGYAEMSRINLDICNEFEVCEKEASAHF